MDELVEAFSLDRVSKAGARFQPEKARWFNAQWVSRLTAEQLAPIVQPILRDNGVCVGDDAAGRAAYIMRERVVLLPDFWELINYFFVAPTSYDEKQRKKYWKGDNPRILREVRDLLAAIDDFSLENTEAIVHAWISEKGYGMGQVMNTLRLALVGAGKGPGMYDVTEFLGQEETLRRIDQLFASLPVE